MTWAAFLSDKVTSGNSLALVLHGRCEVLSIDYTLSALPPEKRQSNCLLLPGLGILYHVQQLACRIRMVGLRIRRVKMATTGKAVHDGIS